MGPFELGGIIAEMREGNLADNWVQREETLIEVEQVATEEYKTQLVCFVFRAAESFQCFASETASVDRKQPQLLLVHLAEVA